MKPQARMAETVETADGGWSYDRIADGRRAFLSPSLATFTAYRRPLALKRGRGQYVWDIEGRRYLDCLAQNLCISVGYSHPAVLEAVIRQMREIQHVTTMYYHEAPVALAQRLTARLPAADYVVHLVNSGAEAIDLAVMAARLYTGNHDILTLRSAYHGMHFSAMAATGLAACRQPVPASPGFISVVNPDAYRGPFGADTEAYVREIAETIDTATPGNVAAMLIEPIQGYGGAIPMPPGYMREAAALVRGAGGVLIVDEVQTGFARTGAGFWGFETHGVTPDLIAMSKGIGNGFPIAAVAMRRDIAQAMTDRKFFNTYGSNPMSCAAALAVLDAIEAEGLQANAARIGGRIAEACGRLADRHEAIGDVRGSGLLLGVDIVSDRGKKTPDGAAAGAIQEGMRERGIILGRSGRHSNVLRVNPPLCVDDSDVAHFEQALDETLSALTAA
ncbi:MAG: hypothetical protein BroJett030_26420 [Alphaproteobacteria bacterium]|nr:MAG: hypothetical protein BroJett030_26420 [Alphaproteobacteria bacterium]